MDKNIEVIQINDNLKSDTVLENESNVPCITLSIIVLLSLLCNLLTVTFIIFMIIGLIETPNSKINNTCSDSHLWYYLLVALIIALLLILQRINSKKDDPRSLICSITEIILSIVMLIWGGYELFSVNCINHFNNTILYKISLAYWILIIIIYGIATTILIFYKINKKKMLKEKINVNINDIVNNIKNDQLV